MLTPYVPTPEDTALIRGWAVNQQLDEFEGTQENLALWLAKQIYTFDYYYSFSDDIKVWRGWSEKEELIKEKLEELTDTETKLYLRSRFNNTDFFTVAERYPLVEAKLSPYVFYIKRKNASVAEAAEAAGVQSFINGMMEEIKASQINHKLIWSNNYPRAFGYLTSPTGYLMESKITPAAATDSVLAKMDVLMEYLREHPRIEDLLEKSYGLKVYHEGKFVLYSVGNVYAMYFFA